MTENTKRIVTIDNGADEGGKFPADVRAEILAVFTGVPPEHNNSPGQFRQVTADANYLYVCVAENTWKRIALSSDTW